MNFRYAPQIYRCAWLLTGLLLGFWGCAKHEPIVTLPIPSASPFSSSGQVEMPDLWWSEFDDSALNDQIGRSLDGSYTLDAALARLRAAQALSRREASDLWPDVNGFSDFESFLRTDGPNGSLLALGLDMTYPVDLWPGE
jgi:outer membrane protein TolC